MASTMKDQTQDILKQIQQTRDPVEAQAKTTILPVVMAYEARFALQQLKETIDPQQAVELIEPLARAVGWAEGLAYVFDRQAHGSIGTQAPTGNGARGRS